MDSRLGHRLASLRSCTVSGKGPTGGMWEWVRLNVARFILAAAGLLLVGMGLLIDRTGLSITLSVLGVGIFVLAVVLPRVHSFSLGAKGIVARLDALDTKIDALAIRTALAGFVAEGDHVVNSLSLAQSMYVDDVRTGYQPTYTGHVWGEVSTWLADVRSFIHDTPGLGEADAILFESQVPLPGNTLKLPERFDDTIALVRAKQDRVRELIERFE